MADELFRAGLGSRQVSHLLNRLESIVLLIEDIHFKDGFSLKEEMEAIGGFGAVSDSLLYRGNETGILVLSGTRNQFQQLARAFEEQEKAQAIAEACLYTIENYLKDEFEIPYHGGKLRIRKRPLIMGVLNVTPDSFYDGGKYFGTSEAIERGLKLAEAGADIIDIGGESTRPGAQPLSAKEEKQRILGVISELSKRTKTPICVDTYKAEVADAALRSGAKMVNDITGLGMEPAIGEVAAQHGAPLVLMHIKGEPRTMQENPHYDNLMSEIAKYLRNRVSKALGCGIPRNRIIIDPGIGFGKKFEHNLTIINRLRQLRSLGYPMLIGVSRKAFIGAVTGRASPSERLAGTLGACAAAVAGGASILRVHDPNEVRDAVLVSKAVLSEQVDVAH